MFKKQFFSATVAVAAVLGMTNGASAEDPPDLFLEHLSDYMWTGSSGGTWQTAGNWTADTDPAPIDPALSLGYPDDPDRMDEDDVDIQPVIGANFSSALTGDLTVNITGGNVTVASVKLGGTGTAVTSSIASESNMLVFENQESNDTTTNPGDPMADPPVQPEPIYGFNQGRALIWSTGTAGAGKENRIDASILANDEVDVEGNRDLHIYGDIYEGDRLTAGGNTGRPTSISSLLTDGAKLVIHGNIQVSVFDEDTEMDGTQDRHLLLNSTRGILVPEDPQDPPGDPAARQGIVEILGHFVGSGPIVEEVDQHGGWVEIGSPDSSRLPLGSVVLRGDSGSPNEDEPPVFNGRIVINRGNLVLAHDNALGGGDATSGNPTPAVGFNFISDDDNRKIATPIQVAQWHTVRGASDIEGLESIGDHSIEFSGPVGQTNTRGWVNLLPAGKELVLSGPQYPLEGDDNEDLDRLYTVDGTGFTRITGGIHNRPPDALNGGNGHFRKRGTGTVVIDYAEMIDDPDNPGMMIPNPDPPTDHTGFLWMEGGNLHYHAANDLPSGAFISSGGGVGFDEGLFSSPGVVSANGSTFLGKFNNSTTPNHGVGPSYFTVPYFQAYAVINPVLTTYSAGGLMLGADEYGENLDFNSSPLSNAANMTLAAQEGGSTYTGTITPSTSVATNPNTYQLGGGAGTLTLPNNNQLTGARDLLVTNGSEVRLEGTNDYTGVTKIQGKYWASLESAAKENRLGDGDATDGYRSTTLTVTQLADGASGLGNSTLSDPANLVVQGSTLRYGGTSGVSTNRLFTVGTAGATIDSSGDGPLTFASTSALGIDVAEPRAGVISSDTPGTSNPGLYIFGRSSASTAFTFSTEDLVPGIRIASVPSTAVNFQEGLMITGVPATDVVQVGGVEGWSGWSGTSTSTTPITFGPAPARFLTLGGENAGDNTLAPLVGDASDIGNADDTFGEVEAGYGTVGIRKTGVGKWILTNNNTYSGETQVEGGLLLINGNHTGGGDYLVSEQGTLGGTGSVVGNLNVGGAVAPGASIGTFTVTGDATFSDVGSLNIELSGSASDLLAVDGNLNLDVPAVLEDDGMVEVTPAMAGTNALNVSTLGSLVGTSWVIASYSGELFGEFESITPGYTVNYGSGTNDVVTLMAMAVEELIGDYNNDHVVNAADYTVWRNNLGGDGSLLGANRDPANTGSISQDDYNSWKAHFGETGGAGSLAGSGVVPEPTAAMLALLALAGVAAATRRR